MGFSPNASGEKGCGLSALWRREPGCCPGKSERQRITGTKTLLGEFKSKGVKPNARFVPHSSRRLQVGSSGDRGPAGHRTLPQPSCAPAHTQAQPDCPTQSQLGRAGQAANLLWPQLPTMKPGGGSPFLTGCHVEYLGCAQHHAWNTSTAVITNVLPQPQLGLLSSQWAGGQSAG